MKNGGRKKKRVSMHWRTWCVTSAAVQDTTLENAHLPTPKAAIGQAKLGERGARHRGERREERLWEREA
jgi:hypothetical protein